MPIKACQGCIKDMFITTTEAIDCFTGKQLWGWGGTISTTISPLGDGTTTDRVSPVQTISGGSNWKQVSIGKTSLHAAAIKSDGTLWTWGYGGFGQLGNNSTANQVSPVQTISGGQNWKSVSSGQQHTAGIKTDGSLWLWGNGSTGQLGNNSTANIVSPVQTIAGGNNWSSISLGGGHTAAIKTDGTLWMWGGTPRGELGDNTAVAKSSPVQTIAGGNNWKQVSSGGAHTLAIKTDGTLWAWGYANNGQLGDNTVTNKSSPVQTIAGGNNWKQAAGGQATSAAIKTDGSLWLWGWNFRCQLGDNTAVNKSSPIQTVSGGLNWRYVATGSHTAAIKTDGSLWVWGYNARGGLGDNTTVNKASPVQTVAFGFNWKQTAVGADNATLAIKEAEF
jgi:alpha-tubulin suppressor-like RCC1 family protein